MLDRDRLEVIDPIADCQDVEEAPEDEVLTEGVMNNPRKLKELVGLIEVDDVQAEFEEVPRQNDFSAPRPVSYYNTK